MRHGVIDNDVVELLCRFHLRACGGQAALPLSGILGASPGKPGHELIPARRHDEDQLCGRHGRANLPSAGQIDLEQGRTTGVELGLNRTTGRPIAMGAVNQCPLQHLAAVNESVELAVGHEQIMHAVDLARSRPPSGRRDRDEQLGVTPAQFGDDGPLAHRGGPARTVRRAGADESEECVMRL